MITIFNRKELRITFSMEEQAKIRSILSAVQIEHYTKVKNRNSQPIGASMRARTGSLGVNTQAMNEYIIYVKKSDYEKAKYELDKRI